MTWRAALLALALLSCRGARPTFTCSADGQCGAGGSCITGACAFGDAACSSGRRWDVSAPGRARACVELPDAAAPADDLAMVPSDLAVGPDLAPPAPDMAVVAVHFYPTLETQVVSYNCLQCHGGATPPPQLFSGDSATAHRNFDALVDYAGGVVATLSTTTHPLHVPKPDLDAWSSWAAAPTP